MKSEEHLERANQLQASLSRLLPDPAGEHVAAITELCYGLAQQLLACGMEARHGLHKDTHAGLPRLLRQYGEDRLATTFERLDQLRAGRWYGGKGNGVVVAECLRLVEEIRQWAS